MTARSPPAARMTGALLSALLYECSNAKADLEGFLTGSVATRKTQRMDDNSDTTVEIEEDFIGYHLLPTRFYDHLGCLLLPILNDIFAVVPPETIVGYFRFRRQTLLVPSLRETTVYRTLCDHLDARRRMCCAVFRFSAKPPRATHTYAYAVWRLNERNDEQLEKLAVTLVNMMESTAEYRSFISNLAPDMPYSQTIPTSLQHMVTVIQPEQVAAQYDLMYAYSMSALKDAADNLIASEIQVEHLRREIESLEREFTEDEAVDCQRGLEWARELGPRDGGGSRARLSPTNATPHGKKGRKGKEVDLLA
ncbi:hypothetical protein BC936DRAFT_137433 [Jimgerdemannia flammicorona]|uniref:Uncharacterized protein n=1 Tax=Jimgerdemannia flammicorona TaxID=994334 RepID=A0A433CXC8_9FUNG|nr:hypothetical protein BC936DRAFT_137433 [Jimgerdemannia flammicorona]